MCLQDVVFKTSSKYLQEVYILRLLEDVLKTKKNVTMRMSLRRLHQDKCLLCRFKTIHGELIYKKNSGEIWNKTDLLIISLSFLSSSQGVELYICAFLSISKTCFGFLEVISYFLIFSNKNEGLAKH